MPIVLEDLGHCSGYVNIGAAVFYRQTIIFLYYFTSFQL